MNNERVAFRGRFTERSREEKFLSLDFLVPADFHKFLKNNFVTWIIGHSTHHKILPNQIAGAIASVTPSN